MKNAIKISSYYAYFIPVIVLVIILVFGGIWAQQGKAFLTIAASIIFMALLYMTICSFVVKRRDLRKKSRSEKP